MNNSSSEKILAGIMRHDRKVVAAVYADCYGGVEKFVVANRGTREDARDVFQDGVVLVYEQHRRGRLALRSHVYNYLHAVCRYRWLKQLRDRKGRYFEPVEGNPGFEKHFSMEQLQELEALILQEARIKLYQKHFRRLSDTCRKVLQLVAEGLKPAEIRQRLNYQSTGYVYKKRRKCRERLIRLIKSDEDYRNHTDNG